jgi:hypothetical protein
MTEYDESEAAHQQASSSRFLAWLEGRVIADGRGDDEFVLDGMRADRFWLGKLGSESAAWKKALGQRGNRLDPCATGFRFRPAQRDLTVRVSFRVWSREPETTPPRWHKSNRIEVEIPISLPATAPTKRAPAGEQEFQAALLNAGAERHQVRLDFELGVDRGVETATIVVVNQSAEARNFDENLYEVSMSAVVGDAPPFELEALPDSFRYDRHVPAYGINCGVAFDDGVLRTTDVVVQARYRPTYWDIDAGAEPELSFEALAEEPLERLTMMVDALARWHEEHWSDAALDHRARTEGWQAEMLELARTEATKAQREVTRCRAGLAALDNPDVLRAFKLMNRAFIHSGRGKYEAWRPFQLGFLLTVLPSVLDDAHEDRATVDTLWFATGGGKTETYLAVVVFACLYDRLKGKHAGVTAWSRFPLRMLSLQQTQRFADAIAGAELARRQDNIPGEQIALGFYVGAGGTPNRVRKDGVEGAVNSEDPDMPARNRVLMHCPFCFSPDLQMAFDRRTWTLQHRCGNGKCPWEPKGLPFYVVDEDIYRLLPSVIIGTLDKAALVGMQAAMRGLIGSPVARCSGEGHGFTYATRSSSPSGCLVPDCSFERTTFDQPRGMFAPRLHIQDELHLLRDSLGAVDSHYETLLDHLHSAIDGAPIPKVIASSATLAGYEEQTLALYRRKGFAFPQPGPAEGVSFWTRDTADLMRRFVGIAPRGQTLEFVNERIAESVQRALRRLLNEPEAVCAEPNVELAMARFLLSTYGTQVIYGIRLRDVEAAGRSLSTQSPVDPLNVGMLTGSTLLEDVRDTLERLDQPEPDFLDRLHVICASSMMSHGVDIDRFNVITLLGVPLATAEFIQTSARIGRRWPGLVFVLHRMGVERDSSVYRSFPTYIRHGNRFVAPIALTRRSRRVLRSTFSGLWAARVLAVHEPASLNGGGVALSTARRLREYAKANPIDEREEFEALCGALRIDPHSDDPMVGELKRLVRDTFRELLNPASTATFISEVPARAPMRSLREVESQIPIWESKRR